MLQLAGQLADMWGAEYFGQDEEEAENSNSGACHFYFLKMCCFTSILKFVYVCPSFYENVDFSLIFIFN